MKLGHDPAKWLRKKSRGGSDGWPIGTVAYYGPDNTRASKVVACVLGEGQVQLAMQKWTSDSDDLRGDRLVIEEMVELLRKYAVRRVGMIDRIWGCPHEEGIDYPQGAACPQCPYWANRDRHTGEIIRK